MNGSKDERDLLMACRRGDEAAARALYARAAPAMRAYARSILKDAALAEDATHAAFLRVFRSPRRVVDAVREPRAWLMTQTRREALTALRTRKRARAREAAVATRGQVRGAAPTAPTPPTGDAIRRAVDALPRRQREVVALKHIAGLTFDQIALALNINRNTAASRHRAAIAALRAALDEPEIEVTRHAV